MQSDTGRNPCGNAQRWSQAHLKKRKGDIHDGRSNEVYETDG